ncbi:MAG: GNAT family N-acetyltransferase [Micrococcaceae bacterium]
MTPAPKIVHEHIRIEHDADRARFELWQDHPDTNTDSAAAPPQFIGFLGYTVDDVEDASGHIGPVYRLQHTIIDEQFARRGYARALVTVVLDRLRAEEARISPECSYVADYLRRYPEYQDLVAR